MGINMAPLTTPCLTRPAAPCESLWAMHQTIHPSSRPSLHRGAPQLHSLCSLHETLAKAPRLGIAHLHTLDSTTTDNGPTCRLCPQHWVPFIQSFSGFQRWEQRAWASGASLWEQQGETLWELVLPVMCNVYSASGGRWRPSNSTGLDSH